MKQTLILKGPKDHFQRQPVYVRWSDGQKRTFKKTRLILTKEQFEGFKKGQPGKDVDLYKRFLSAIDTEEVVSKMDFFKYCASCKKEWAKEKASETLRQHDSEINKLTAFKPSFSLHDITPNFLKGYKEHLYKLGNTTNTVWKSFKYLRLIVRKAHKEKLIEENPFDVFQMPKYRDPEKQYLTEDQIKELDQITDLPKEILFVRDWFLISCYTGLRFGDMHAFDQKKHLRNNRLILYTSKTGEVISLPLSDKVNELFERVDYKAVPYSNTHFNRLLKQIDIGSDLNCHKARHSFAVLCASKGISQEVTAKLMGHTSLKTTAIYYKITGVRSDEEYAKLF